MAEKKAGTMISYRRDKNEFVSKLRKHLELRGIDYWIDTEGIPPGSIWRDELFRQLQHCEACIAVLSKGYILSDACRMEVFVARSFGRLIIPVMLEDCFAELREHEETRGLEDIFMMRMFKLNAVGLPIDEMDVFERIARGIKASKAPPPSTNPVYISYCKSQDASFATEVATELSKRGVDTWIATLNVNTGENWRDAQARAMMRASSHVVVLDENIVRSEVLRTELLLSEARGLPTFAILPPRLSGEVTLTNQLIEEMKHGHATYLRLTQRQYFTEKSIAKLHATVETAARGA